MVWSRLLSCIIECLVARLVFLVQSRRFRLEKFSADFDVCFGPTFCPLMAVK